MYTTRAFKNGNSQAVRIPAELAYARTDIDLEIEREGDEIRIRPARRSLSGVLTKFAKFSPGFMAEGRGDIIDDEKEVGPGYPQPKPARAPFDESAWDLATMTPKSGLYPGQKPGSQEKLSDRDRAMREAGK